MENSPIRFNITYNWLNMQSTWLNENIYLDSNSSDNVTSYYQSKL